MITILRLYWKQILFWLAIVALIVITNLYYNARKDAARERENVRQSWQVNPTQTLTKQEIVEMLASRDNRYLRHIDSIVKANRMNPKGIIEEHNVTNIYKDTTILKIDAPKPGILKPIDVGDKCWGFKGVISSDGLVINQRYSAVEIDLFDYAKPKKFLFIRIGWNKPNMKAFSDCGTVTVRSFKRANPP
ncbi:MAG: hypothetical protein WCK18_19780 [Prolixibacteraceae bacterium]